MPQPDTSHSLGVQIFPFRELTPLSTAQAKAEFPAAALGMAQQDAVAAQSEADQARDDLVWPLFRATGGAGVAAQSRRCTRFRERTRSSFGPPRAGLPEAREQAEQALVMRWMWPRPATRPIWLCCAASNRQVSQLADFAGGASAPLSALEPVVSKQAEGAS